MTATRKRSIASGRRRARAAGASLRSRFREAPGSDPGDPLRHLAELRRLRPAVFASDVGVPRRAQHGCVVRHPGLPSSPSAVRHHRRTGGRACQLATARRRGPRSPARAGEALRGRPSGSIRSIARSSCRISTASRPPRLPRSPACLRGAVAMKVHRIKRLLARQFNEGAIHDR